MESWKQQAVYAMELAQDIGKFLTDKNHILNDNVL